MRATCVGAGSRVLVLVLAGLAAAAAGAQTGRLEQAEQSFLAFLESRDAAAYVESGSVDRYEGHDLVAWTRMEAERRRRLEADLDVVPVSRLGAADVAALGAMRRTLDSLGPGVPAEERKVPCSEAQRRDLDLAGLRAALVGCFREHGDRLAFDGRTIDRGTALQLLHVVDDPTARRALFDAFLPLWTAVAGRNEPQSPYRRMIALAAADAARHGSAIDSAALSVGLASGEVEHWLVRVLEAWREAAGSHPVEPWDYRYVHGAANRALAARIPTEALRSLNARFFVDLGADVGQLGVVFDLDPRPDKSPLAYTDFLQRGRRLDGRWQRPVARVVGTYPEGGLFSLNELVHETGHAVHVGAIRTRPAFMDWPDTLLTEAIAEVASWSVYEPAWQRRYLGVEVPETDGLRALLGDVMLDVAWALFELRLLRDPEADPNVVWTDITSSYLGVVAHPELPWWAMRVQLAGDPGYMVNYGLGAVLTAEIRERTSHVIGPFDAGNPSWYPWLGERLLRFGSERDTVALMQSLLGRPPSPEALIRLIMRAAREDPPAVGGVTQTP